MPKNENWDKIPLTELLDTIVDNRGKSVPTSETGFPLIATNCIKHSSIYPMFENIRYVSDETLKTWFRAELKPNDILFVNKGSPGRVCLVPNPVPFCAAQDMVGLRCNPKKVYYKYLFAYLRTPIIQQKIENYHVGIMIPHFKKSDMDNLLIELPEMPIQRKIGDLYLLLSEKIELNNKISADLESLAKTIYDYWFLQFEFPDANGKPYKSSGGRMVWNEALKREVPEGWDVFKIDELVNANYSSIDKNISSINYLDTANLTENQIENIVFIDLETTQKPSRAQRKINKNDILISTVRPNQHHYGIIKNPIENMVASTGYTQISCKLGSEINEIIYLWIIQPNNQKYLEKIACSATSSYPSIRDEDILNIQILLPKDEKELKNLARRFNSIYELIESKQRENRDFAALRDFLLPMLMNGQVTFKDEKECPA